MSIFDANARRVVGPLALTLAMAGCARTPTVGDEDVARAQEADTVCAAGATAPGIDISEYQGSIDWGAVAGGGYNFAIARINDGNHLDPYFGGNWAGIKNAGMIRGAYQFYEPTMDPAAQANIVINAVGMLGAGDLPVTLDVEWTSGSPNANDVGVWVDMVTQGTGKRPMIYTAVGYWNQYFNGQFSNVDLWVANWGVSCPSLPDSWSSWLFWQTGGGGVPGIAGDVDEDVFNGSLQDLVFLANANTSMNCAASSAGACGHFGCACVDDACNGGFCPGTGCTAQHTNDCGNFGCGCVDGGCSGGFCPGTGCTAKETNDCGSFGCGCVDHQCNGVFCPGTGCTAKETNDCGNYGCGCVDHQCGGGFCPGSGCTAKETNDCAASGQSCASHACVAGSSSSSTSAGAGGGTSSTSSASTGAGGAGQGGDDASSGTGHSTASGPTSTTGAGAGHPHGGGASSGAGGSGGDAGDGDAGSASGCAVTSGPSGAAPWLPMLGRALLGWRRRRS